MQIEHNEEERRFTVRDGDALAELHYRLQDGVMVLNHTFTPEELRGRGIAGEMMTAALEYARAGGIRVTPLCSYAHSFMERHHEYDDLLADTP